MRNYLSILFTVTLCCQIICSCGDESNDSIISSATAVTPVKDIIEDISPTEVKIGTQIWMKSNLNVETFRNGDPIPQAQTEEAWILAAENDQPAWCYYENDSANGTKYGKLYNWHAVNDYRGLAPKGWIVPSSQEWEYLLAMLGGHYEPVTLARMKNTFGWSEAAGGVGNNESKLGVLPGGLRYETGRFDEMGVNANWWTRTERDDLGTLMADFYGLGKFIVENGKGANKDFGYSIRCIRKEGMIKPK